MNVLFIASVAVVAADPPQSRKLFMDALGLPFVMALKPRHGTWAYGPDAHTPVDAARALAWDGPEDPGGWSCCWPIRRPRRTAAGCW